MPGSILNPLSKGPHSLIKQGAKLVEDVADIVEEIPEFRSRLESHNNGLPNLDVANRSEHADPQFLRSCGWDLFTADDIVARSRLTVQEVSSMLLKLELTGIIQLQGTGSYLRIR